jgi:hypothetical protein
MHVSIPEPGRDVVRLDLLDDSAGLVVGKGGRHLVPLEEHGEEAGHLQGRVLAPGHAQAHQQPHSKSSAKKSLKGLCREIKFKKVDKN